MNTENNKIIAEFMEWEIKKYSTSISDVITPYGQLTENQLKFHKDWNWLMEVVEKIETLNYGVRITRTTCFIDSLTAIPEFKILGGLEETKIQAVYNACVGFINWHNEQK